MEILKQTKELAKVNVAPSSDEGHFVEKANKVVNMDNVTESYLIEGKSILTTKNHTNLNMEEDCLVNCQVEYNPFSKMFENARD